MLARVKENAITRTAQGRVLNRCRGGWMAQGLSADNKAVYSKWGDIRLERGFPLQDTLLQCDPFS